MTTTTINTAAKGVMLLPTEVLTALNTIQKFIVVTTDLRFIKELEQRLQVIGVKAKNAQEELDDVRKYHELQQRESQFKNMLNIK